MRIVSLAIIMVLIVSLVIGGTTLADGDNDGHMDDMMGGLGMTHSTFWIIVLLSFFVVLSIWIYTLLVKADDHEVWRPRSNASFILDERYARGEIVSEEYFRMKNAIEHDR